MTEKAVEIIITVEIEKKVISQRIKAKAWQLDKEIVEGMERLRKEIIAKALEELDEQIREQKAKEWKNLGREKHRIITAVGEIEIKRRVYRDERGKRRKPLDEIMELGRYQRETNNVRMMGAWLATQNTYREAAEELSYLVKRRITHSKIQRMVWEIGNQIADKEEREMKQWDGAEENEQKTQSRILYGESDGVMISLQREKRRKAEERVGILYTGKKAIGVGRKRLENKVCMTRIVKNSAEWKEIIQKTADKHYDLEKVRYLITGGDGNSWVKRSFDYLWVEKQKHILDRYHLYRASKAALGLNAETIQLVRQLREKGYGAVVEELNEARKKAGGRRKKKIAKYIRYLEDNQDVLKDVKLPGEENIVSLGAIEGNVDKLVARRMKGRGRSWRRRGARAMITLCRYKPQLRELAMKFIYTQVEKSSLKRTKAIPYSSWLDCTLPIFSSAAQSKPWVKELRRNLSNRSALSMEYL